MADPISQAAIWVANTVAGWATAAGASTAVASAVYAVAYVATYAVAIAATSAIGGALGSGQKSPTASEGQLTLQQPLPYRRRVYGTAALGGVYVFQAADRFPT
jgi:hypothetical protein